MEFDSLLDELQKTRSLLTENIRRTNGDDYRIQYHPELSPLGWHLGHCVYTELYWIRECILNEKQHSDHLKSLYTPELSPKPDRGGSLPELDSLCAWAETIQSENHALLSDIFASGDEHVLLENCYLLRFLIQHYAQHYETTLYVLALRVAVIQNDYIVDSKPDSVPLSLATNTVSSGRYRIGSETAHVPYDNESPSFLAGIEEFNIGRRPVTNAEYLTFIHDGGYETPGYWTDEGWQWRTVNLIDRPLHWHRDVRGHFYRTNGCNPAPLASDQPVSGLSYHEALACANWAGARLPHEYEWETAKKLQLLEDDGLVWEWCSNYFHPYPQFVAFPYAGYSSPYFDDRHYSLRGGSIYTLDSVRRATFRNYYKPDCRHIHAGVRLVYP